MPTALTRHAVAVLLTSAAMPAAAGMAAPSLERPRGPVPANAVATLTAATAQGAPDTAGRLEVLRDGRWRAVGPPVRITASGTALTVRAGPRPGVLRVRLAHGPGLRAATAPVGLRVVRTGWRRVVAGHTPVQALVRGRDLWVFTWNAGMRRAELRLLDARTGRPRRGPVRLPTGFAWDDRSPPLLQAGGIPLLDASLNSITGARPLIALDAAAPRLLGAPARFRPGSCAAVCTPNRVSVRGRTIALAASLGARLAPVRGADGRFWDLAPVTDLPWEDEQPSRLFTRPAADATASEVGVPGAMGPGHAGQRGSVQAVRGGAWITTLDGRVWWASPGGGLTAVPVRGVHLAGTCTWGYRSLPAYGTTPGLVPLTPGSAVTGTPVRLAAGRITVGDRVAWIVSSRERTLIRVPLPAC